jgi:methionyl-tRNA formyltransferase
LSTVFLGTTEFAVAVLERLASSAYRPALVVTRPDRPRGRGQRLASPPVAQAARALGIPLAQPVSVNDEHARALIARAGAGRGDAAAGRGDAAAGTGDAAAGTGDAAAGTGDAAAGGRQTVLICSFGALIKEPLLSEHELLNVHPSPLPRWRGAAPIERAIEAGDTETGVSIMRPTAGFDSGPVCLAASEPIRPTDTYGSLASRLQELGAELLLRALEQAPPFVEQPEQGVSYAEKIGPRDRLLDPARPAVELERVVRALHPHIGARVALADGGLLGVQQAALAQDWPDGEHRASANALARQPEGGAPAPALGLTAQDGRLLLICARGVLELLEVQPPGGRTMETAAFLRGHRRLIDTR